MRHPVPVSARVLRHELGRWVEPAAAFAALLSAEPNSFWLDSGDGSGMSYLGAGSRVVSGPGALDEIRADLASTRVADAPGFQLGWVGWLGYETRFETLAPGAARDSRYPRSAFLHCDRALAFDHDAGSVALVALADSPAGEQWPGELAEWRDAAVATLEGVIPLSGAGAVPAVAYSTTAAVAHPVRTPATWAYTEDEYLALIARCQVAIRAGDAYLLCLTTEAAVAGDFDPFATYLALRATSPAHHGGLLRIGGVALLSASPEQFLSVMPDGVVESRPIKGTRRRGGTPEEDAQLRRDLLESEKERAENLMIVDLMRNDIGRVSALGSVEVPSLFAVETYPHVHQLVSTVRGHLAPGLDAIDAVKACFPAGSMTGAPKLSATTILDGLEQRARGVYSGAFGYFGHDGRVDLAMVIRSIVLDATGATVGSGGGITALSDPREELDEVRLKAAALLAVLGA